jgi:hypothetical protein
MVAVLVGDEYGAEIVERFPDGLGPFLEPLEAEACVNENGTFRAGDEERIARGAAAEETESNHPRFLPIFCGAGS